MPNVSLGELCEYVWILLGILRMNFVGLMSSLFS